MKKRIQYRNSKFQNQPQVLQQKKRKKNNSQQSFRNNIGIIS